MKNVNEMTPEDVRAYVLKDQARKAKQIAANRRHKELHPPTAEQLAKRKAYNKARSAERIAERRAILQKAQDLGLLPPKA